MRDFEFKGESGIKFHQDTIHGQRDQDASFFKISTVDILLQR